jgi:hypothetical protein
MRMAKKRRKGVFAKRTVCLKAISMLRQILPREFAARSLKTSVQVGTALA